MSVRRLLYFKFELILMATSTHCLPLQSIELHRVWRHLHSLFCVGEQFNERLCDHIDFLVGLKKYLSVNSFCNRVNHAGACITIARIMRIFLNKFRLICDFVDLLVESPVTSSLAPAFVCKSIQLSRAREKGPPANSFPSSSLPISFLQGPGSLLCYS